MNQRGSALVIFTFTVLALLTIGAITYHQVALSRFDSSEARHRTQALWLARSAATRPVSATVRLQDTTATVTTSRSGSTVVAKARVAGAGTATVTATFDSRGTPTRWTERYQRD